MDCPEPIQIDTPKIKDMKIIKSKRFKAKDDESKSFDIEMGVSDDSIIFKTLINNGFITTNYSSIYSFEKLKQNNIFSIQDNIEEIYEQIEIYINDEPVSIKIKENNIIIKLLTRIKKCPEIFFELKEEAMDKNKLLNFLIDKIKNLELKMNIVESLEKKINNLNWKTII